MDFGEHCLKVEETKFDCLLFDLDDTLYPLSSGISAYVRRNIEDYMAKQLGVEESIMDNLCNILYTNYGTTMAGLRAIGYKFNYDDYHRYVHGTLPYHKIKKDAVLKKMLSNIPIRKIIFTNSDKPHTVRALRRLGLEECFDDIICFETLNRPCLVQPWDKAANQIFDIAGHVARSAGRVDKLPRSPVLCKPNLDAMQAALTIFNIKPNNAVFFDDSIRNIQAGKKIGLHTVLVGSSSRVDAADHAVESIHDIREALPELFGAGRQDEGRHLL